MRQEAGEGLKHAVRRVGVAVLVGVTWCGCSQPERIPAGSPGEPLLLSLSPETHPRVKGIIDYTCGGAPLTFVPQSGGKAWQFQCEKNNPFPTTIRARPAWGETRVYISGKLLVPADQASGDVYGLLTGRVTVGYLSSNRWDPTRARDTFATEEVAVSYPLHVKVTTQAR